LKVAGIGRNVSTGTLPVVDGITRRTVWTGWCQRKHPNPADPKDGRSGAHPNVWAAGDGANVDTDPSGGALRRQISILVDNLLAARTGGEFSHYDGYTVAPIATSAHRLILGEFDRTGSISTSLPSFIDPLEPRRTTWAFDRYALPQTYWNLILKGVL